MKTLVCLPPLLALRAFQVALVVKNPPAHVGDGRDLGLTPGSRRSPGGGHGNPVQYSCLENPMDRGAWKATIHSVAKSWTWLSEWAHMHASGVGVCRAPSAAEPQSVPCLRATPFPLCREDETVSQSFSWWLLLFMWTLMGCPHLFFFFFGYTPPFSSVQLLSRVRLFVTPGTATRQGSLSITNSWSLFKLMSGASVMPSNHLILSCPLLFPPSTFPSIRVFSSDSAVCIRWPKYWSFSFSNNQSFQWIFRTDFL